MHVSGDNFSAGSPSNNGKLIMIFLIIVFFFVLFYGVFVFLNISSPKQIEFGSNIKSAFLYKDHVCIQLQGYNESITKIKFVINDFYGYETTEKTQNLSLIDKTEWWNIFNEPKVEYDYCIDLNSMGLDTDTVERITKQ